MKYSTLFLATLLAPALCALTSCGTGAGKVDIKYPTVQQQDDMDVQWGLPRRQTRGSPARSYSYDGVGGEEGRAVPPAPSLAPAMRDPVLDSTPPPAFTSPAPMIPDTLR